MWSRARGFNTQNSDRERTWSDETTHAIHESQTLRIERVHDNPGPRDRLRP
ncbi:hypothetical protein STENM327S_03018 [Streptomyces tendae]